MKNHTLSRIGILSLAALFVVACTEDLPVSENQDVLTADIDIPTASAVINVADVGFETPESVVHDDVEDVYLVSNINGHPQEDDNNGFISKLAPDGTVSDLKWIEGGVNDVTLHAPKGMVIVNDVLYVSDVDGVRLFDRETGDSIDFWEAEGDLLNDLCAGPEGTIYQTDAGLNLTGEEIVPTESDAIYRFEDGEPVLWAEGAELSNPNGCVAVGANVHVVTLGSNEIYRVNPSGKQFPVATVPEGALDGIVRVDGDFYVTSWDGSAVYRTGLRGGRTTAVIEDIVTPADLGYDAERHRLLVPSFEGNEVVIHPL